MSTYVSLAANGVLSLFKVRLLRVGLKSGTSLCN